MSDMPTAVPEVPSRGPGSRRDTVGRGFLIIFLLNLSQLALAAVSATGGMNGSGFGIALVIVLGFGLVQLVYVVPLAAIAYRAGERERMKGMIVAASIPLLLNGACWGLVATK